MGLDRPRGLRVPQRVVSLIGTLVVLGTAPAFPQSLKAPPANLGVDSATSVVSHDADGRVVIHATRVTQPLRIDGQMDEEIYRQVPPFSEFIQQVPHEGAPVSERTEMWVLFDDEYVYVACQFWDERAERIVGNDMRRDSSNLAQQDRCDVSLDTLHDQRTNYLFTVTPLGGMRDGLASDEVQNFDWNGVWDARATRSEHGWFAEIAIPFKTLRFQPSQEQVWGIQLRRIIRSNNEQAYISPVLAAWGTNAVNHMASAAALVGIQAPPGTRHLDIKPYAISRVTTDLVTRPTRRNDFDPELGVDVKYGVTESLTASFSYNTDFAEAEVDDAQVNLTRFNLFFPEKREFFLEANGAFQFGIGGADVGGGVAPTIFYSRRIGLNGSRVVPVIGGGRLAGKAGAWTLGALSMQTEADDGAGVPQTNFTVLRLRRDILKKSYIGGILTRRSDSLFAPGANDLFGVDGNFAFYQNVYLNTYIARSRTDGRHGNDLSYRAQLNYTHDRYGLMLDRNVVEEHFNPEIGFMPRSDFRRNFASARFSPRTRNHPYVRKLTFQGSLDYITDNHNRLSTRLQSGLFTTEMHNSDTLTLELIRNYEHLPVPFQISRQVQLPAGGYSFDNLKLSYLAGQQRRISGTTIVEIGSFYDGDKKTVAFKGRASVMPQLAVEPNISLNWVDLPLGTFTSTVVGANATFSMTPRRFVAALVQYSSNTSSLSTNIRFRWEYRLGSELFVVYTEGRSTFPGPTAQLQSRGIVLKINYLLRR